MSWASFNRALEALPVWNRSNLRLFMDQRPVLPPFYCNGPDGSGRADPAKVMSFLGMGASVIAAQMEDASPGVRAVVKTLGETLGAKVSANVYCSFQGVQAFGSHYDPTDVLVVQTEGEKRWRIYQGRAQHPSEALPPGDATARYYEANKGGLAQELTLRSGEALYLPRGQYHDALAMSGPSLHVTFSIEPLTGLDLFDLAKEVARHDPEFRKWIPDHRLQGGAPTSEVLSRLAGKAASLIQAAGVRNAVERAQLKRGEQPGGYDLPAVRPPQWYQVNAARVRLVRTIDGDRLEAGTGGQTHDLGAAGDAAAFLLQNQTISWEGLSAEHGYLGQERLKGLVEFLLSVGALVKARTD
ncbi:MAG: cupin domain-containing protein [Alphaproteobacteria bacterium]|nr:cupin domain-containing protein [Alphaproteobacteria bacterium]